MLITWLAIAAGLTGCSSDTPVSADTAAGGAAAVSARGATIPGFERLKHVVVIYLENHSFDNLYGEFAGANGLSQAVSTTQVDLTGTPFATLPQPPGVQFPANLANAPFSIEQYVP